MNRLMIAVATGLTLIGWSATASAVSLSTFQVGDGGSFSVTPDAGASFGYDWKPGGFEYKTTVLSPTITAGAGATSDWVDLFEVSVFGFAMGSVTATVQFTEPDVSPDPLVEGDTSGASHSYALQVGGDFGLLGLVGPDVGAGLGAAVIDWQGPVLVTYGNGGRFLLELNDVEVERTNTFTVQGRVTNLTPVPEPATLFLLGTGLIGVSITSRNRRR